MKFNFHAVACRVKQVWRDPVERWMFLSGFTGFTFFILANCLPLGAAPVTIGCMQVGVNFFVFSMWMRGTFAKKGKARWFALGGALVPIVMMSITLYRVVLPAFR